MDTLSYSIKGKVCEHNTILIPPLLTKVIVPKPGKGGLLCFGSVDYASVAKLLQLNLERFDCVLAFVVVFFFYYYFALKSIDDLYIHDI